MYEMTTRERMKRIFEHREADRIPIIDVPWPSALERWQREGMPSNTNFTEYFNLDKVAHIFADNSPLYEERTLEETEEYKIFTTNWGTTLKNWKHVTSTPEFLDFRIKDLNEWIKAKKRMTPDKNRIPWSYLQKNYKKWRDNGYWIQADLTFGFDATHSWIVGTERFLMALIDDPQWCIDIFEHSLNVQLELLDLIWEAGYEFDSIFWCDDMGYKGNQFFSVNTYRQLLKPFHKRAVEWARRKGIKSHLHSCGDIKLFIPELMDIGIDALNPMEVKAGMNPLIIKKEYGEKLVLHGGINAVLWNNIEAMETEIRRILPVLKSGGGYIFASDHSIPDTVNLNDIKYIINLAKELGQYN